MELKGNANTGRFAKGAVPLAIGPSKCSMGLPAMNSTEGASRTAHRSAAQQNLAGSVRAPLQAARYLRHSVEILPTGRRSKLRRITQLAMKGQYFSFDAIVATVIMAIAITTLVAYWFGAQSVIDSRSNPMQSDAMRIAESLLSPGVPANWTKYGIEDTYQFGLTDGYSNALVREKLNKLGALASANYTAVGRIMRAPADYYIRIDRVDCGNCGPEIEIGHADAQAASEVVVAHRGAVLEGRPVRIRVFLGK